MTTPPPPAGWYPDPDGSDGRRYWDGWTWTAHRSPAPPVAPPLPPPPVAPTQERVGAHRAPEPDAAPGPEPAPPVYTELAAVEFTAPSSAPPASGAPTDNRKLILGFTGAVAALLLVLVLVVIYGAFIHKNDTVRIGTAPPTTSTSVAPSTPGGWGAPTTESGPPATESPVVDVEGAADGPLTFAVLRVENGTTVTSAENDLISKTAVGEYVVVHLRVANTSDAPTTFLGILQKLKAGGTTYSIDDEATFYLGGGPVELNPGDQFEVAVAFDVPPGTVPESVELHGVPLSAGVELPL